MIMHLTWILLAEGSESDVVAAELHNIPACVTPPFEMPSPPWDVTASTTGAAFDPEGGSFSLLAAIFNSLLKCCLILVSGV